MSMSDSTVTDACPDAGDEDYVPPGPKRRRLEGRGSSSGRVGAARGGRRTNQGIQTRSAATAQPLECTADVPTRGRSIAGGGDMCDDDDDFSSPEDDEVEAGEDAASEYDMNVDQGLDLVPATVLPRGSRITPAISHGVDRAAAANVNGLHAKLLRRREQRRIYARKFRRRQTQEVVGLKAEVASLTAQRNRLRLQVLECGLPLTSATAPPPRPVTQMHDEEEISVLRAKLLALEEAHRNSNTLDAHARRRIVSKRSRVRRRVLVHDLQATLAALRTDTQTLLAQLDQQVPTPAADSIRPSSAAPPPSPPTTRAIGVRSSIFAVGAGGSLTASETAVVANSRSWETNQAVQAPASVLAIPPPINFQVQPPQAVAASGVPMLPQSPHLIHAVSMPGHHGAFTNCGNLSGMSMPFMNFPGPLPLPPWFIAQTLFGVQPPYDIWAHPGMQR